ncbi:MAG: hypothetical protein AABY01_00305 [Nanoarchaeota archaeon]
MPSLSMYISHFLHIRNEIQQSPYPPIARAYYKHQVIQDLGIFLAETQNRTFGDKEIDYVAHLANECLAEPDMSDVPF